MGLSNADILTKYPEFHESPKYGWKVMLAKKDNHCVFLKKGEAATCSVYKAVPRQCRGRPLIGHVNPFLKIVDLETMNFTINPCQGFGTGPEYTVEEWIQLKGLKQGWQDELDYLHNIYSIKCKSLYHLKSAIIGLYTK